MEAFGPHFIAHSLSKHFSCVHKLRDQNALVHAEHDLYTSTITPYIALSRLWSLMHDSPKVDALSEGGRLKNLEAALDHLALHTQNKCKYPYIHACTLKFVHGWHCRLALLGELLGEQQQVIMS